MRPETGALVFLTCLAASDARADWEVAIHGGPTFPFYEQSVAFDPGPITGAGGAVITQTGEYRLDGQGGLALGAALAYHPHPAVGLELRVDTADVDVVTGGSSYRVRIPLPIFGTVDSTVSFTEGEGDLERLRPVSLNLRLRSPGTFRVTASGGVSYLPEFRFAIRQPVAAGLAAGGPQVEIAEVVVPAEARPGEEGDGRWGINGGVGIQYAIGPRLQLIADGRYFHFQSLTLYWGEPETTGALLPAQDQVVDEIAARLDPARFNPTFFQATVGIALSF